MNPGQGAPRRRWPWIALGAFVCLLAWIAVAAGLALDVDRTTWILLVTVAAFATEGLVWLTAALLGLRVFEARRQLWQKLRGVLRRP